MQHATADLSDTSAFAPQAGSQDYNAQQSEMSQVSTFDWFSKKMLPGLLQATAIVAVAAIGLFGSWGGTALAGLGMLGFELVRAHFNNKADLNRELVLYHKDIAKALGKSPAETLTLQDMRHAADENVVGDKAIKPLQMELKHLDYRGRYNFIMGAVRAVVTTAGAVLLQGMMAQAKMAWDEGRLAALGGSMAWPLTGTLGLVAGATAAIEGIGKSYFNSHEPPSVYHELTQLQKMSKTQALTPEPVFDVIVKLDKELANEINMRFGKPYEELSHRNKVRVMEASESRSHAHALAEAINNDTLPVTAIAMSACHQLDWASMQREPVAAQAEGEQLMQQHDAAVTAKSHTLAVLSRREAQASTECRTV